MCTKCKLACLNCLCENCLSNENNALGIKKVELEETYDLKDTSWISVLDSLPDPEVAVLAIVDGYDGILTIERRWERCVPFNEPYFNDYLYWDWVDNDGQDFEDRVKFWMPIPKLPQIKMSKNV